MKKSYTEKIATTKHHEMFFQPKLTINKPNDIYEQEADAVAEKVIQSKNIIETNSFFQPTTIQSKKIQRDGKDDPVAEGIATVGEQLGENNPAFSQLTEKLADQFLAQPKELSIGLPAFLISNYAFLWSSVFWNRNMRKHLNDFNLGTIPGLVPHFPIKTFTYRIQNDEQTKYEFDFGLDFSSLFSIFNKDVFNTHISDFSLDTSGQLNTDKPSLNLSELEVNMGLFNGGLALSGGFRNGVSQYPLFDEDDTTRQGYRIMQQVPGLPDLRSGEQDIRFTVNVDILKMYDYFSPSQKPFINVPIGNNPADTSMIDMGVQRKCTHCEEEEELQRKEENNSEPEINDSFENYVSGLNNNGTNLSPESNQFFSQKIGYDFSNVKIHTDGVAAKSASSINALAYTTGNHIVFNQNQYQPKTDNGKKLLAHELTHVVQQNGNMNRVQKAPKKEALQNIYNPAAGVRILGNFSNKINNTNGVFAPFNYKAQADNEEFEVNALDAYLENNCVTGDSIFTEFFFSNASAKTSENDEIVNIGSSIDDWILFTPKIKVKIKYRDESGMYISNYAFEDDAPQWGPSPDDQKGPGLWRANFMNPIQFNLKTNGIFKIKVEMIHPVSGESFLFETNFIVEKCDPDSDCFTNALATGRWVVAPLNGENIQPLTGSSPVGENYEMYVDTSKDSEAYFICHLNERYYLDNQKGNSALTIYDLG